ncbi:LOW QUALITY PROTEIN: testis-specific serine/threonine-protein kinase 6 [Silurus meridionalis]|uniref:LOW QUALITY PROTEIN: testis-specific serine/threonine-protein kinase 6 n=1 Tax=Silurus meridionalis TaxID=175797 RepID=UPI001EEBDACF|nr:LOW QUALITY PROTEIN: testis-specific serine/threonine-protein kinase 6 [Silurus meridionalis]
MNGIDIGEVIGYTLSQTLGLGGYSKVKCAYDKELKINVAIKITDRRKVSSNFWNKFLPRELEIQASLNHPHITKMFKTIHIDEQKHVIVMELASQGDLQKLIKINGKLSEDLSKKLFLQLSVAVKYLHDQNIVHRDLKCENLLLDHDFNLKVADFGFSKRLRYVGGKMVLSNTFCGSAGYMSPEILQKISYNPKTSDVWSMGVVLFNMLVGTIAFDDSSITRMGKQKQHVINFPVDLQDNCKNVCDLITCMLNPDPDQRFDINQVIQHPWVQEQFKLDQGSLRESSSPSTSETGTEEV